MVTPPSGDETLYPQLQAGPQSVAKFASIRTQQRLDAITGWDLHRLEEGKRLVIGGVDVPHTKGTIAHSDGELLSEPASAFRDEGRGGRGKG